MDKRMTGILVAALLAVAASTVDIAGNGQDHCSTRTLRGRYVFSASGFTIEAGTLAARPKAIIELIDFNGDGSLEVLAGTRSLNGAINRFNPQSFTYTVAENCTGTITFDGPTFDIIVSSRGNQLWLIQTNNGNVFEGSATRTSRDTSGDGDQR
jgi:hypothetical protein